jgi:hypothetical protein
MDPDIYKIHQLSSEVGCEVYMHPFLYAFGLFQHNVDQIKVLDEDIQKFKKTKKDAAFVLYLGVVNHWVTLIVHKTAGKLNFYLLDSSNLHFLDKVDA